MRPSIFIVFIVDSTTVSLNRFALTNFFGAIPCTPFISLATRIRPTTPSTPSSAARESLLGVQSAPD